MPKEEIPKDIIDELKKEKLIKQAENGTWEMNSNGIIKKFKKKGLTQTTLFEKMEKHEKEKRFKNLKSVLIKLIKSMEFDNYIIGFNDMRMNEKGEKEMLTPCWTFKGESGTVEVKINGWNDVTIDGGVIISLVAKRF